MPSITDLFGWATSGNGRLIAAAVLFVLIFLVERAPFVKTWINVDGWHAGMDGADGWLKASRKKAIANVLMASVPTAFMLTTETPLTDVTFSAVAVILSAAGLNSMVNTFRPANSAAPPSRKTG